MNNCFYRAPQCTGERIREKKKTRATPQFHSPHTQQPQWLRNCTTCTLPTASLDIMQQPQWLISVHCIYCMHMYCTCTMYLFFTYLSESLCLFSLSSFSFFLQPLSFLLFLPLFLLPLPSLSLPLLNTHTVREREEREREREQLHVYIYVFFYST